jgi:trimeric autotransporter adhesin
MTERIKEVAMRFIPPCYPSAYNFLKSLRIALFGAISLLLVACSGGGSSSGSSGGTGPALTLPDNIQVATESKRLSLNWTPEDDVEYDLFWSTDPELDPEIATSGEMEVNIQPPFVLDDLQNDQNYYFFLRAQRGSATVISERLDTRLASPGVDGWSTGDRGARAVVQSNDGRVFIGGTIFHTGHSFGTLQAIDLRSGHARAHNLVASEVTAIAADGQGGYYYATTSPEEIRRVNADGNLDDAFLVGLNNDVYTMLVHDDTLYIGGDFSQVGGVSRNNLAALSLSGEVRGWSPNPEDEVLDLAVHNQVLYAAGRFSSSNILGAGIRSYVAAFDLDQNRTLMDWAPEPNGRVESIKVFDDRIVLGGSFTEVNSTEVRGLAFVDHDGDLMGIDLELNNNVDDLSYHDGWLYVAGTFTLPQSRLFRTSLDGQLDSGWPAALPNNAPEKILATDEGVFVGADIDVDDTRINNFYRYLPNGEVDLSIGLGVERAVESLALVDDRVLIGSRSMIRISGNNRGLAVLDLDGRWQDFPVTLDGNVQHLRIHQGNLYVGGRFGLASAPNEPEPVERNGVAVFSLANAELQPFSPQITSSITLDVHHILPVDGDYVIGGRFDTVNGSSRRNLVRVDATGQTIIDMDTTSSESSARIVALALSNDHIYVGGTFDEFGGNAAASHVARVFRSGPDAGEIDTNWLPDISNSVFVGQAGVVNDLVEFQGTVYMAGSFTQFDGTEARLHLAAVQTNETLSGWTADLTGPSWTRTYGLLHLENEDAFLVTGTFDEVNGTETGRLALVNRSNGNLTDSSVPLAGSLLDRQQSSTAYAASRNAATGNICVGMLRHQTESRIWVGVYCMDHFGDLLW